jgi:uncharacterized protein (DUF427 family)
MARATWRGTVLAESDDIVRVEGNAYFPEGAVRAELLRPSSTKTVCSWKGEASYYDVVVGDAVNRDAVWVYRHPKPEAAHVKDRLAFWRGVEVEG